jgi:hypothetical protein
MVSGLFARVTGRGGPAAATSTVKADLKRITHSGLINIPKDVLSAVNEASNEEACRLEIMAHLRECLAETGKNWKRVYGALLLSEELLHHGSPELLHETAQGRHFDLVQRLSFLEHFACDQEKRAQGMVRSKAVALRAEFVPRIQSAGDEEVPSKQPSDDIRDDASTCSPGESIPSCSTTSFPVCDSFAAAKNSPRPKGRMILDGVVAVGHSDDTTDESSADESNMAPVRYGKVRRTRRERTDRSQCSQGSDIAAPAQTSVDLLDL